MSRRDATLAPHYFDGLYAAEPDPWGFRTSDYEHAKYDATLAALPKARYGRALEVGCSIGVFTARLALRCDALLAIDASDVALASARAACESLPHVSFDNRMVPEGFPDGPFDLIVLSEVLYYLDRDDLARLAARCKDALRAGGDVILCHWLGETDYPLSGREASDGFAAGVTDRLPVRTIVTDEVYRLERLSAG